MRAAVDLLLTASLLAAGGWWLLRRPRRPLPGWVWLVVYGLAAAWRGMGTTTWDRVMLGVLAVLFGHEAEATASWLGRRHRAKEEPNGMG